MSCDVKTYMAISLGFIDIHSVKKDFNQFCTYRDARMFAIYF